MIFPYIARVLLSIAGNVKQEGLIPFMTTLLTYNRGWMKFGPQSWVSLTTPQMPQDI